MSKLKTLKDIKPCISDPHNRCNEAINIEQLRSVAISWIREMSQNDGAPIDNGALNWEGFFSQNEFEYGVSLDGYHKVKNFIKYFFNLTEEDLT